MANELKHGSVGTELTQAEWEGVGTHVFNSQATGDIVYASSSSQLSRLAKGTDTHVLILSSGIPAWSTSTGITAVGTIATGTWQGTDVGVAYGGTGVSTLTDGGILLGSGASAITAMAVLTDGQMIVGDGTTDPVAESGATLRTSIGVGTGDSPSFTALTLDGDLGFTGPQSITTSSGALTIIPTTELILGSATGVAQMQTNGITFGLAASAPAPDNNVVHIWNGSAGTVDAHANAGLILEDDGEIDLQFLTPNDTQSGIRFGDPDNNTTGAFLYNHSTSPPRMQWMIEGGTRMWYSATDASSPVILTLGGGLAYDVSIVFDNAGTDYHIGIDQNVDDFVIGRGTALGTTPIIIFDSDGRVGFGATPHARRVYDFHGSFALNADPFGFDVRNDLTTLTGGTEVAQLNVGGSITTYAESQVYTNLVGLAVNDPQITLGSGSSVTNATTLKVVSAPSEGTNNYALWVDAGVSRFDGDVHIAASSKLYLDGGTHTYISERASDDVDFYVGGVQALRMTATSLVINNGAANYDLLVYHDDSSIALKVDASANNVRFGSATAESTITMNDATVNAKNTGGLTINQGALDDEILAFKSSDVSHPFTARAELDTYADFKKVRATGGLDIVAYQDTGSDQGALILRAYNQDAADTGKTTSDYGLIRLLTAVSNGSDNIQAVGADGNLVSFDNANTTRFIFDAEGSGHADVEWVAFDDYDDLALISDIESELLKVESSAGTVNRHMLEKTGIIGKDSWHMENGKPRAMINMTKLSMLHHGALMQAADKIKTLESRLLAIEGAK